MLLLRTLLLTLPAGCLFGQLLYVPNTADDNISTYVIDPDTGVLNEILPRAASSGHPTSVTIHPSGKFLYVTNLIDNTIPGNAVFPSLSAYSIDPGTGALTPIDGSPYPVAAGPQWGAIDPSGSFLLISSGSNNLSVFSIDSGSGALTAATGSPYATAAGAGSLVIHAGGKYVYLAVGGQIAAFNLASDGTLTPLSGGGTFAARTNITGLAQDPAGKFLFAAERQDNGILAYAIDASTGALTLVTGSPFLTQAAGVSALAVDATGAFLFVSNQGNSSMSVMAIGADGTLTQQSTTAAQGGAPFSVVMDPSNKFVYVVNQFTTNVAAFTIDFSNNGKLAPVQGSPFMAGAQPARAAAILLSPPVPPPISVSGAFNAGSFALPGMPNYGIAQGSRFTIAGKNLGPATAVSGTDFPLQSVLGGSSIQITSAGAASAAIMTGASRDSVSGILPSGTPLGDATLSVTYAGQTSAPIPISVVPTNAGIFTRNLAGSGPARVLNYNSDSDQPLNALNVAAQPGQTVTIRATGLGAVSIDETMPPGQAIALDVPLEVFVGNRTATVLSAGRDPLVPGLDDIRVQLPADAQEGCYVPLAVRAAGVVSNVASISISSTGTTCSDPVTGLMAADIDAAQAAGRLALGMIVLRHIEFSGIGEDSSVNGGFSRYAFPALLAAVSPGSGLRLETVGFPPPGSCTVTQASPTDLNHPYNLSNNDPAPQVGLNAGATLNFSGPAGSWQLTGPDYSGKVTTAWAQGNYTVDNGAGTQAVGPFTAALVVPAPITWTNVDSISSVPLTVSGVSVAQDLTLTWSGGDPAQEYVLIAGLSTGVQSTAGFLCTEKAAAGQFTVPAWVTSTMPASAVLMNGDTALPGGLVGLGTASITTPARFTAAGLDVGFFLYEQLQAKPVPYQ